MVIAKLSNSSIRVTQTQVGINIPAYEKVRTNNDSFRCRVIILNNPNLCHGGQGVRDKTTRNIRFPSTEPQFPNRPCRPPTR